METFLIVFYIIAFGAISGASGGALLGYALVKEIRRLEKKYGEKFKNGDI